MLPIHSCFSLPREGSMAREKCSIPHITSASPLCPSFDTCIEAGSIIVAIEPHDHLAMSYVPFKPRASLTKMVGSHLDGSNNWRRGGAQCVMVSSDVPRSAHHRTPRVFKEWGSSETPTLNQPLTAESQSIQLD